MGEGGAIGGAGDVRSVVEGGGGAGAWVGVDLGTTNTVCAAWDLSNHRPRLIRMGSLAHLSNPGQKYKGGGKIVPTTVLFRSLTGDYDDVDYGEGAHRGVEHFSFGSKEGDYGGSLGCVVGQRACDVLDRSYDDAARHRRDHGEYDEKMSSPKKGEDRGRGEDDDSSDGGEGCGHERRDSSSTDDAGDDATREGTTATATATATVDASRPDETSREREGGGSHRAARRRPRRHRDDDEDDNDGLDDYSPFWRRLLPFASSTTRRRHRTAVGNRPWQPSPEQVSAATVTSVKRILGLATTSGLSAAGDGDGDDLEDFDERFLKSLPFEAVVRRSTTPTSGDGANDTGAMEAAVFARVRPLLNPPPSSSDVDDSSAEPPSCLDEGEDDFVDVDPIHVAAAVLRSVRMEAERTLNHPPITKKRIVAPGMQTSSTTSPPSGEIRVRNCVIGVPATFGRNRCEAVVRAARLAGFDGKVETIVESTAAALAYGLFVSPDVVEVEEKDGNPAYVRAADATDGKGGDGEGPGEEDVVDGGGTNSVRTTRPKSVLVFDMGGGTTDVTVVTMSSSRQGGEDDENNEEAVRFEVGASAGDDRLGGDDFDELLMRWFLDGDADDGLDRVGHPALRRELLRRCREAKEDLCGNFNDDTPARDSVVVEYDGVRRELTSHRFDEIVEPLVGRAADVVEEAVAAFSEEQRRTHGDGDEDEDEDEDRDEMDHGGVDEVVLVGGGSRVPAIRRMLRRRFVGRRGGGPPDLCYSLQAEAAVAHGCAIRSALRSGKVPLHELRNAMMLDALPHTIGVLVPKESEGGEEGVKFVPVLERNAPLPARGYVTLTVGDEDRACGVTVDTAEDVGGHGRRRCQPMGTFNFMLHRLDPPLRRRTVDVGMSVETDGRFIVSIFDWNDPEHLANRDRYMRSKTKTTDGTWTGPEFAQELPPTGGRAEEKRSAAEAATTPPPMEQTLLAIACLVLFVLYVWAKLVFNDPSNREGSSSTLPP